MGELFCQLAKSSMHDTTLNNVNTINKINDFLEYSPHLATRPPPDYYDRCRGKPMSNFVKDIATLMTGTI